MDSKAYQKLKDKRATKDIKNQKKNPHEDEDDDEEGDYNEEIIQVEQDEEVKINTQRFKGDYHSRPRLIVVLEMA